MSDSDSFIQEVSEEVRRERLFAMVRRYGWIAVVLVIVIVGGATFNEVRKANARSAAQAFGDEVLAALEAGDPAEQRQALDGLSEVPPKGDLVALLSAASAVADEDPQAAADLLRPLVGNSDLPAAYSDLAALKLVLLNPDDLDATTRAQLLDRLAAPGAPYRLLALEQQALALAEDGEPDAALDAANALLQEPGLTQDLVQRVAQLIVALGGDVNAGDAG